MSFKVSNAVWMESKAEGLHRLIMLSLADRADDAGRCFCGAHDIMKRTKGTRSAVFKAIRTLKKSGELKVLKDKGPRKCNRYQITLNQCSKSTSVQRALVSLGDSTSVLRAPKPLEPKKSFSKEKNGGVRSCL